MYKRIIYYLIAFLVGIGYSQDVPSEFEYDQSTSQAFYLFDNFQILDEQLDADDWIGVFNIYDGKWSVVADISYDDTNDVSYIPTDTMHYDNFLCSFP